MKVSRYLVCETSLLTPIFPGEIAEAVALGDRTDNAAGGFG